MFRIFPIAIWFVALATSGGAQCTPPTCDIFSKPDPNDPCQCTSLLRCDERQRIRREYRDLTADQRAAFVRAVYAIEDSGIWGQISQIHNTDFVVIHDFGNFFPWHTGLLIFIETLIMDLEPSLPGLPYFAWGAEASVRASNMWNADFMGGSASSTAPIPDGPFAGFTVDGTPVTRNLFGNTLESAKQLAIDAVIANVPNLPFWSTTGMSLSDELELLHNFFHVVVGGTMVTGLSPRDPVFYLHHAYVDRWWSQDWPETLGFVAEDDPVALLEGLSLNISYANLGNFTLADSAEIQRCISYAEPGSIPQTLAPIDNEPIGNAELVSLAKLQGTSVQGVEDTAAAIVDSVQAAVESTRLPQINTDALVAVSGLAEQFDVAMSESLIS